MDIDGASIEVDQTGKARLIFGSLTQLTISKPSQTIKVAPPVGRLQMQAIIIGPELDPRTKLLVTAQHDVKPTNLQTKPRVLAPFHGCL